MSAPRRLAGALVLLLIVGIGAAITADPAGPADPPRPCVPAVLVDDRLACGPEAAEALALSCPHAQLVLHDGDVVTTTDGCRGGVGRMAPQMLRALGVVIDVQTASIDDLRSLPGVGPAIAQRIVAGRPYASVEELLGVRGIGPATLARMRPRVTVGVQPGAQ